MISRGSGNLVDQPLYDRLWGSGFLPSRYQGVKFRSGADPVLYLSNPSGVGRDTRRRMLDDLAALNQLRHREVGDPEITKHGIAQHEMAFRMQTSVPDLADLSKEPEHVFKLYGEQARKPGTYAANCLLARRLVEPVYALRAPAPTAAGTSTRRCRSRSAGQCRDTVSTLWAGAPSS